MSTWCALYIRTSNLIAVAGQVSQWLKSVNGGEIQKRQCKSLDIVYGDRFIVGEESPTMIALGTSTSGWTSLHFNSFNPLSDLAKDISRRLETDVVTVMMQSVSEAYYIQVFRNGGCLRRLSYSGDQGEWDEQSGNALPFESKPLGHNIAGMGEEPFYVFDRSDTGAYCRNLGFDPDDDMRNVSWQLFESRPGRKWWRFW